MDLELKGRVALITGGTRGIGFAAAQALAAEGASVSICGRTVETLDSAVAALRQRGVPAHGMAVDALAPGGVESFVAETVRVLGRLDFVLANLGGTAGGNFLETTPEQWVETLELNLVHAARVIRAAAPHLERSGVGSVVIVASISGFKPGPRPQYGASKAAEIFLASALARELAPQRIRVNSVSPGSILIPGNSWDRRRKEMPERIAAFVASEFPWGRMGTGEELANAIAFLLSPRSSWVNGANLVVDGAQGNPSIRVEPPVTRPS